MALIPEQISTLNLIETTQLPEKEDVLMFLEEVEKIIKEKSDDDNQRGYLGMSGIGDPCERKLWYGFHMVSKKEPHIERTKRIFNTGHIAEGFIYKDLKKIGYDVFGAQESCVGVAGHFSGHIDGKVSGVIEAPKTIHLLEMKTMNDKNFKEIVKTQSVQKSKPVHYAQMQCYMHYQNLTRALYIAYNKNTSEYYIERVYYDKDFALDIISKATKIIMSEKPPLKEFAPTWYACKFCDHRGVCHDGEKPAINCRTCIEADICDGGKWECGLDSKELSVDDQKCGCEYHKLGWGL